MNKFFFLILSFLFFNTFSIVKAQEILDYDFSSTKKIPIELISENEYSTKEGIQEGEKIALRVRKNVIYKGNIILKTGDIVKAQIETVVTSGMNGFPAEIIIDDFEVPNIKNSQIMGTYTKYGTNRCLWVYPLKWALTPIPFVGSLTNLIKGGHAKIKKTDIITVYYYPEWK